MGGIRNKKNAELFGFTERSQANAQQQLEQQKKTKQ